MIRRGLCRVNHQPAALDELNTPVAAGVSEHTPEDLVDIAQRSLQIERMFQRLPLDLRSDFLVLQDEIAEVTIFFPRFHRIRLDEAVSIFTQYPGFHKIEKQLPAEDEPAGGFQILHHAQGIYEHGGDEVGGFV